jgi:hypothetical protein
VYFLGYAEKTHELRAVFDALCAELGKDKNLPHFVEQALVTNWLNLVYFLGYAEKTHELRAIFDALCAELGKDKNLLRLVERALVGPLGQLRVFLNYAEDTSKLKATFDALCGELGKDANRSRLVELALLTPLDQLHVFLEYPEETSKLRVIVDALRGELGKDENRSRLVDKFCVTSLKKLADVLSPQIVQGLWGAVLWAVDRNEWDRVRLRSSESDIDAFVRFRQLTTAQGRPELASAPSLALLRKADPTAWHHENVSLDHLSHVLECASNATDKELLFFLKQTATTGWIDSQLMTMSAGRLAGSLLRLSNIILPDLRNLFVRPTLQDRVISELTIYPPGEFAAWADSISLLGAAATLGLRIDCVEVPWPESADISAIVALRTPGPEMTTIGPLQVQLWPARDGAYAQRSCVSAARIRRLSPNVMAWHHR